MTKQKNNKKYFVVLEGIAVVSIMIITAIILLFFMEWLFKT